MSRRHIPYFDFYPSDFINGVRGLTPAEVGIYIMVLCRIYEENGPVEYVPIRLAAYCGTKAPVVEKAVQKLVELGKLTLSDGAISSTQLDDWWKSTLRNNRRPWIPVSVQEHVRNRDGDCCRYCNDTNGPFHLDHVIPYSAGGQNTVENLVVACAACNWAKGASEWELPQ